MPEASTDAIDSVDAGGHDDADREVVDQERGELREFIRGD